VRNSCDGCLKCFSFNTIIYLIAVALKSFNGVACGLGYHASRCDPKGAGFLSTQLSVQAHLRNYLRWVRLLSKPEESDCSPVILELEPGGKKVGEERVVEC